MSAPVFVPQHAQTKLAELGIEVDTALAPLIRACWARGIATAMCCQGDRFGDGYPAHVGFYGYGPAWRWEELVPASLARLEWIEDEEVATDAEAYFALDDVDKIVAVLAAGP